MSKSKRTPTFDSEGKAIKKVLKRVRNYGYLLIKRKTRNSLKDRTIDAILTISILNTRLIMVDPQVKHKIPKSKAFHGSLK